MKVVLIGNYLPDNQQSMIRFVDMMQTGLEAAGQSVEKWLPIPFFGLLFPNTQSGVAKWAGYVDKWILFPPIIWLRLFGKSLRSKEGRFHVCDHSNAPYLQFLPKERSTITCHDTIAIESAMGIGDASVGTSKTGYFLQKWILKHLARAKKIACVSTHTEKQLKGVLSLFKGEFPQTSVIHNAFNADFYPMSKQEAFTNLSPYGIVPEMPFLLHVGGGHPRKNREMLVNMLEMLSERWHGKVCYCGQPINPALAARIEETPLKGRVISVVRPDHQILVSLYSVCEAFIFPSFAEGFGWPPIEAQACGAVVITSDREPMKEVCGEAAMFANPADSFSFTEAFLMLNRAGLKDHLIQKGYENVSRFSLRAMIDGYTRMFFTDPH